MQEGRKLTWESQSEETNEDTSSPLSIVNHGKGPLNQNVNAINPTGEKIKDLQWNNLQQNPFEEKRKFTVNDIIKDARKDKKLTSSSSHQVLGEKKILRKLQL